MDKPGNVVTVNYVGATEVKRRPAIVVMCSFTTQFAAATDPTDYILQDCAVGGLRQPSAFRAYLGMAVATDAQVIGHLSERVWIGVQDCLARALAVRQDEPYETGLQR